MLFKWSKWLIISLLPTDRYWSTDRGLVGTSWYNVCEIVYLLFLLQELCWLISHLGNEGSESPGRICDGDTKETFTVYVYGPYTHITTILVVSSFACIEFFFFFLYLSHQFSMHFGHTVNGPGSLYTQVWGWIAWRRRTEGTDRAGDEQAQAVLQRQVEDVMKTWWMNTGWSHHRNVWRLSFLQTS